MYPDSPDALLDAITAGQLDGLATTDAMDTSRIPQPARTDPTPVIAYDAVAEPATGADTAPTHEATSKPSSKYTYTTDYTQRPSAASVSQRPYLSVVRPRRWDHIKGEAQPDEALEAVREAIKHSWDSYARFAWGQDELRPLSKTGRMTFGDTGITIVDSIDTLLLAGLQDDAHKCVVCFCE